MGWGRMIDRAVFELAVAMARTRFPDGLWDRLPAGEQVEAVHHELKRIAPESMDGMIPLNSGQSGTA
jgi:hypothetical protein